MSEMIRNSLTETETEMEVADTTLNNGNICEASCGGADAVNSGTLENVSVVKLITMTSIIDLLVFDFIALQ